MVMVRILRLLIFRAPNNPPASNDGSPCVGETEDTRVCDKGPCPPDSTWTEWTPWTQCSQTCGPDGIVRRYRECLKPDGVVSHDCIGLSEQAETCNNPPLDDCPVDGEWCPWSPWSGCSKTCDSGTTSRNRTCDCPTPANDGVPCHMDEISWNAQHRPCARNNCPVDCTWDSWTQWSDCTRTCGSGLRTRSRGQTPASFHGLDCVGEHEQTDDCSLPDCPNNECPYTGQVYGPVLCEDICPATCDDISGQSSCQVSCTPGENVTTCHCPAVLVDCTLANDCIVECPWTPWSECSKSCGVGMRVRYVDNSTLVPGQHCTQVLADTEEYEFCNKDPCPVNGSWSTWGPWSSCSADCDGGTQLRYRECNMPPPKNGGANCPGNSVSTSTCNLDPCEEQCAAGFEVSNCSNTCPYSCSQIATDCTFNGTCVPGCRCPSGQYESDGQCVDITQCPCTADDGKEYPAGYKIQFSCKNCSCVAGMYDCDENCPVDCSFSTWSTWTACSVICGLGNEQRFRAPNDPPASNGGSPCVGETEDTRVCDKGPCPPDCIIDGTPYTHNDTIYQDPCMHCICYIDRELCVLSECNPTWTEWTPWTQCSQTCGPDGIVRRYRECLKPNGVVSHDCIGMSEQAETCNNPPLDDCPVDGEWCPWSPWSGCSKTCDSGTTSRNRTCDCPTPANDGVPCHMDEISWNAQHLPCASNNCPVRLQFAHMNGDLQITSVLTLVKYTGRVSCETFVLLLAMTSVASPAVRCHAHREKMLPRCHCPAGQVLMGDECILVDDCPCTVYVIQPNGTETRMVYPSGVNFTGDYDCQNCTCEAGVANCVNFPEYPCRVECDAWTSWSPCHVSCGTCAYYTYRYRECPDEHAGPRHEVDECPPISQCPMDCYWMNWSTWSTCSATCGGGTKQRSRWFMPEMNGGIPCTGSSNETYPCNTDECPTTECPDGQIYDECYAECKYNCMDLSHTTSCRHPPYCIPRCRCPDGMLLHNNTCIPEPQCPCFVAIYDNGEWRFQEMQPGDVIAQGCNDCVCEAGVLNCSTDACSKLDTVGPWSSCSATSANAVTMILVDDCPCTVYLIQQTGQKHGWFIPSGCQLHWRLRLPQNWWTQCPPISQCPMDCYWMNWSTWSTCSATCGGGTKQRSRWFMPEMNGGIPCTGSSNETYPCNTDECPTTECPYGQIYDECYAECKYNCMDLSQTTSCRHPPYCIPRCRCPDGMLLHNNTTCDGGYRERTRTVDTPANKNGQCKDPIVQRETCGEDPCGVDCPPGLEFHDCANKCPVLCEDLSPDYSECVYNDTDCVPGCVCPSGMVSQADECVPYSECYCAWSEDFVAAGTVQPLDSNGNPITRFPPGYVLSKRCLDCTCVDGEFHCNGQDDDCDVNCEWDDWVAGDCSAPCGPGTRNHTRGYRTPALYGGSNCTGDDLITEDCNEGPCRVDCPPGLEFHACANKCPVLCEDLSPDYSECVYNDTDCVPGCVCPSGMASQAGECIPYSECYCAWSEDFVAAGTVRPLDSNGNPITSFPPGYVLSKRCLDW
ncbi:PREDICTED: SCO-spondin-like [Priapulus caudatus]|uniref:SCO-spondin-like n=1 Tax=Priapulus caudatus TaxID=37621 RepID=A0ABM1E8X8_PRICU|nr:PREDICTED: SCO-spondin-like [Priapulus caudatus]